MTARTIDDFWGLSEGDTQYNDVSDSSDDDAQPDLTDYRAFEQVLRCTRDGPRQQFIQDLLNTTVEIRNEHDERRRTTELSEDLSSNKPPWLRNTRRPANDNIHDHFIRYKEAKALKKPSTFGLSSEESKRERPITTGVFFDDIVSELFEGHHNETYDNLDLSGVEEAEGNDWDGQKIYTKSERDVKDDKDDKLDVTLDDDDTFPKYFNEFGDMKEAGQFIGAVSTTTIGTEDNANYESLANNSVKENKSGPVEQKQNTQSKAVLRDLEKLQVSDVDINSRVLQYQNKLISQKDSRNVSPAQKTCNIRPMDMYRYFNTRGNNDEVEATFQNSDEDE